MKYSTCILALIFIFGSQMVRADFSTFTDSEKTMAIENYNRYNGLPADKKTEIKENWNKFNSLSSENKMKIEKKFVLFKKLTPQKREQLIRKIQTRQKVQHARAIEKRVDGRLEKRIQKRRKETVPPPPPPPATTSPYPPHT